MKKRIIENDKQSIIFAIELVVIVIVTVYCACLPDLIKYGGISSASLEYLFLRRKMLFLVSILFFLAYVVLTALFSRPVISSCIMTIISFIVGVANQNMVFYRGQPLLPTDILQTKDAIVAVEGGFSIYYPPGLLGIAVLSFVICIISLPLPEIRKKVNPKKEILITIALVLIGVVSIILVFNNIIMNERVLNSKFGRRTSVNVGDMYYLNGFWGEFFSECIYLFPQSPDQYSQKEMAKIGEVIQSYNVDGELVDIITLQVESWQFTNNYDVQYGEDVFLNYNRLAGEGITGLMVSPKYGGGTADIEYEVLTGFTTNDGYTSVTPFNNVVYEGFPNIVNYLKNNYGYETYAIHAYTGELYNRPLAYKNLGFSNIYFSDTFENPKMCGPFISDQACVEKMIEVYDKACKENDHVFLHGLTMQNHLPMADDRFDFKEMVPAQSATLSPPDLFVMQRFGTALKWTDEALGVLCDYLKTIDRKVIVIAYGDHQTSIYEDEQLGDVLHHTNFYDSYNEETDFILLHGTPYIVWTNYDNSHGGETFGYCAPNMLLVKALNRFGIECPNYWSFFAEGTTSYKSGTAKYIITNDEEILFSMNEQQEKEYHTRMLIQYDLIYGKHYLDKYIS